MNRPTGYSIGNWLEVKESIDCLKGGGPVDTNKLAHLLSGTMICLGGKVDSIEDGIEVSHQQVDSGEALKKFLDIVEEQGGKKSFILNPSIYSVSNYEFELKADSDGYIKPLNTFAFGMATLELGAGRKTISDSIDPSAGIILKKKIGDKVVKGETILVGYTNKPTKIDTVSELLYQAVDIGNERPTLEALVTHISDSEGTRAFEL